MNLRTFTTFNFMVSSLAGIISAVFGVWYITTLAAYISWVLWHVNQTMVDPWDFDEPTIGDLDDYT